MKLAKLRLLLSKLLRSKIDDSPTEKSTLWSIASLQPKSERFSQLTFKGFRPSGKSIFVVTFNVISEFLLFLISYAQRKIGYLTRFLKGAPGKIWSYIIVLKIFLVRKLIWSRGKLARPIATAAIMLISLAVFTFGEVLNSSSFVNNQEVSPDYLRNISDIIPKKAVALTTIPDSRKQSESFTYNVASGDTLSNIGEKFKISVDALRYVNNLSEGAVLKVGQELTIPPVSGLIHEVASGDTLESIAEKYSVSPQAVADFNYILDTSSLAVGTELVIPGAKVPKPVYAPGVVSTPGFNPANFPAPTADTGFCVWPTARSAVITQGFFWYHNGIDIGAVGAWPPIYACREGTVVRAGWDPWGLGLHVRVDHGNGYETVYGHMNRLDVSYGQHVSRGQVLGQMGNTGRSTGPHVHFMVNFNGVPQNPLNYTN